MKYNPTGHAIERARQRFGITPPNAKNWLNQLIDTAKYVSSHDDRGNTVLYHEGRNVKIVVNERKKTVVTVMSPITDNPIIEKTKAVIQRELAKAKRQFTREYRILTQQYAEINIEIAKLTLNHVRCRQPLTQALIQERIDAMKADLQRAEDAISNVEGNYEQIIKDAETYLGGVAE